MNTPTLAEREVIIRWSMADKVATIHADNPVLVRKLDKLCAEYPEAYRCTRADDPYGAKRYEVDVKLIRFGKPASEARKESCRQNGLKGRLTGKFASPDNL